MAATMKQPPAIARDLICGMAIVTLGAVTRRLEDDTTYYFCSESCARQFDCEHAPSSTTSIVEASGSRDVELPVVEPDDGHRERQLPQTVAGQGGSALSNEQLMRTESRDLLVLLAMLFLAVLLGLFFAHGPI
jgi:YHS domain-containing protein